MDNLPSVAYRSLGIAAAQHAAPNPRDQGHRCHSCAQRCQVDPAVAVQVLHIPLFGEIRMDGRAYNQAKSSGNDAQESRTSQHLQPKALFFAIMTLLHRVVPFCVDQ